ncbi:peptidoglycan recognition protein family protein [Streptomyces sp. NBC_01275]|uniref:peptidoglycan recognition protein family protein n=1 Tax=Streptomyces sp. NBC_01275 TaxID=2903807 RepID=UPI00225298EF|nr:peptidoglycan recognition family protein [Streptomyces sp. NBC_01275]MCX4762718.1 peptidoglycan recognition protein family protein [Streptomyces sp. NBC_01275]
MSEPPTSSPAPSPAPAHRRKRSLSRRGVIGTAGAVAAGAALTPVVFAATDSAEGAADTAAGASGTTPETFPATRTAAATGAGSATTAFAASYVGVRWSGAQDGARIRLADGAWQQLSGGCATVDDGGTALVAADAATSYEVQAPQGATGVRSLAIDTTGGPDRTFHVPKEPTRVRGVRYLSRPAWGADESKRYKDGKVNSPEVYYPLQAVTVHHTDTPNDDPDPAATVRGIYEYHAVTLDWGDIGYHFLIDEAGVVYEGRYSGEDPVPAFDADGKVVTAFHTGGFNSGNLGIALLGTLTDQGPTPAAKASLTRLIKVITRFKGLDPQAKITYVNPVNGVTKDVTTVGGHRDWLQTECPGQTMYDLLTEVRAAAAR